MEGIKNMHRRLSYDEQASMLCKLLREEIDQISAMPKEEAKKVAHNNLIKIGFLNEDGTVATPYVAAE